MPYSRDATIVHLIESRAAATPRRPAIVFGGVSLSYAALDRKANRVAETLTQAGVGRGDLVPLLVGNTPMAAIAMIGAMKCAAPFVPLDERWPAARRESVLAQLRARAIVCLPDFEALVPSSAMRAIAVGWDTLDDRDACGAATKPSVDDLIYGFFTSGSTGEPKCALNGHLGLLNRFLTMSRRFAADGGVVLQNSSHTFDSSIWQLLWPLTLGNTVVIPRRDGLLDLTSTLELISQERVTMTDFVPSIFNALVALLLTDAALLARLRTLRRLLIGGEAISSPAVRTFRQLAPHVRLTNTYGPTECSIGSVWHEIDDDESIPLGLPIDNTVALVLGEHGEPARGGEVGEIHLGGDCLGRGYLHDPDLTRRRFVDISFGHDPGHSFYATGDVGYVRDDGALVFVGRADDQVKVGGVRIELAEIERAFTSHEAVAQAHVTAIGELDARRLVALIVPSRPVTVEALRDHVARWLPPTLLPKSIVRLPSFPVNANGKVDRRALAALAATVSDSETTEHVEPDTDGERAIQAVWMRVLERRVGVTDRFFDVGGDSLLALRLTLSLRNVIVKDPPVSVADIVAHQTIRGLAALDRPAHNRRDPTEDLIRADVALAETIPVRSSAATGNGTGELPRRPLGVVLLTGATGFVGVHVLEALLSRMPGRVICLVRTADAREARERIAAALSHYALDRADLLDRVDAIAGDLAAPGLGLSERDHDRLVGAIDSIVHCGAMVNLLLDYHSHRAANVLGTLELLRLAAREACHFHFISTVGVFGGAGDALVPEECAPPLALPSDGYSRSKWAAEHLLARADGRVASSIFRLGEVGPHSETGIASARGLVDMIVRAGVALNLRFESAAAVDWTPVDAVAALVAEAVNQRQQGEHLNIVRPAAVSLSDLFASIARRKPLRSVSYAQFWERLCQGHDQRHPWAHLAAYLPEPGEHAAETEARLVSMLANGACAFAPTAPERLTASRFVQPSIEACIERYAERCVGTEAGRAEPRALRCGGAAERSDIPAGSGP